MRLLSAFSTLRKLSERCVFLRIVCVEERTAPIVASVRKNDNSSHKLLQSHPEVVNHLLKNCATDHAIAKFFAAILRHVQSANMSPQ